MLIKLKKAQVTAEYAILVALVVAAAMGIQNEVRRAIQARIHDAAVDLVTTTGGRTLQYEPSSGTKTTKNQKSSRNKLEYQYEPDQGETAKYLDVTEHNEADYESDITQ
jgi:hypothetical protein